METDRSKQAKPKYLPIKCVVCNGFGTVNWGRAKCHSCDSRGYILVPAEEIGDSNEEGVD